MPRATPAKSSQASKSGKKSAGKKGETDKKPKKRTLLEKKKSAKGGHRFRAGIVAVREIKRLQKGGNLLIQKAPFQRVVRAVMADQAKLDLRFKPSALEAVQEATEHHMTSVFEGAVLMQLHRQKMTLTKKDIERAFRVRAVVPQDVPKKKQA